MDEGACVPEVRYHAESESVDATGVWSEGSASYPGRPAVLLIERIVAERRDMERRESAEAVRVAYAARQRAEHEARTGANHS